jgi:hypothetical protein
MKHKGRTDEEGNFRDQSREKDGYINKKWNEKLPFEALVTAWFPGSQTINVSYWTPFGQKEIEHVSVYGNFMEAVGTIKTPRIATAKGTDTENSWQIYKNPSQDDPNSDQYVLDNHIGAFIYKTNTGYVANGFRFVTPDSPLLKNAKYGRTLTRYDDGSYRIHDDDGNMQFKHPSGLSIKIGKTGDDIDLDSPLPNHAKNVQDYDNSVVIKYTIPSDEGEITIEADGLGNIKLTHPNNSFEFNIDKDGKLEAKNATTSLKKLHDDMNDIVAAIVVNDGVGPNTGNLTTLKTATDTLLK